MFLNGKDEIRNWLQGHFPNMQWYVSDSLVRPLACIVNGYADDLAGARISVYIASECHPAFLDGAIEAELVAQWGLPDVWKGEYVEYDGPNLL